MLKNIVEWYKVVNPKPSDELIEKRTTVVTDVVKRIATGKNQGQLATCIEWVLLGTGQAESPYIEGLIEDIKKGQPSFTKDVTEVALEIRILSALILGELVVEAKDGTAKGRASHLGAT